MKVQAIDCTVPPPAREARDLGPVRKVIVHDGGATVYYDDDRHAEFFGDDFNVVVEAEEGDR